MKDGWTTEWPKESGTKWYFYGWAHGVMPHKKNDTDKLSSPQIIIMNCTKISNGWMYVGKGFMYEKEAIGVFKRFPEVEVPDINDMINLVKETQNKVVG